VGEIKKRITTLVLGAGVLASLVLLATQGSNLQFLKNRFAAFTFSDNTKTGKLSEATARQEVPVQMEKKEPGLSGDDPLALNATGVSLVLKRKLWEGMYYFDRAIRLDASLIIPVINMAVVLNEIGLSRPAARYIAMAEAIDPAHPMLPRNLNSGPDVEKSDGVAGTTSIYEPRALGFEKSGRDGFLHGKTPRRPEINGSKVHER
jgi:hypothetical protein